MTEKEKNSIPVDLITKYLSGEANTDDIIDLERWKAFSEENLSTFDQYRRIWESTGELTIFADIDIEIDHEWETFLNATVEETKPAESGYGLRIFPILLRMAAIMVIALLLGYSSVYIYRGFSYEKFTAPTGKINVDLPDGSQVMLNKGAVLEVPKNFKKGKRLVRLNGEAFFNVSRDITRPFTVKSGNFVLQVLGTSFNVLAYKKVNIVEVIVKTGEVEVYPKNREDLREILSPGQKALFSRENKKIYTAVNLDPNFDAWKTGVITFNDATMEAVATTIEKVYGKKVFFHNSAIRNCRITMSFDHAPLDSLIKDISDTLSIQISESGGNLVIYGEGR